MNAVGELEAHGAGLLVVSKRDRLARDVVLAAAIEQLVRGRGARVVSAAGEGSDDADDPSALLMRRLVDAFAEYERALIRARTRAALAVKKKRNERAGELPFGYRLGADGRTLEPHPVEQAIVARVGELRAAGESIRGIVATLAREGMQGRAGRPLSKGSVENLVRRVA
jgi:DNA invertase Pin-like site-specific DNA recombinase